MAEPSITTDDLLRAASGFAPDAPALLKASEVIQPKRFTAEFASPMWPEYNGKVVMRYPSLGDMLKIEALAVAGDTYHQLAATLAVCIEQAPATWYRLPEGAREPMLALDQIQDSEGLLLLWRDFLGWRRTFRVQPEK